MHSQRIDLVHLKRIIFNGNSIKTKSIPDALSIFELELERLRVSIKTFKLNLDLRDFRMDEKFWDV